MLNGQGFVHVMWMFVGIWMGFFLARVVPDDSAVRPVPADCGSPHASPEAH
jgi:hypothetical protein